MKQSKHVASQRTLLAVVFLTSAFAGLNVLANEVQQKLQTLLSGNSIHGEWAGTPYKQYFNPNGETIYQEQNQRPSTGRWRINNEGKYCSVWPPSAKEACYETSVEGKSVIWHSGENRYSSVVVDGRQM